MLNMTNLLRAVASRIGVGSVHGSMMLPRDPNARYNRSKYTPHQGKREMARRVRQMQRGILPCAAPDSLPLIEDEDRDVIEVVRRCPKCRTVDRHKANKLTHSITCSQCAHYWQGRILRSELPQ